ncbi:phosphorylase b kinase regulatory subunit beta isoform X2 [Lingula anatina]|uniref:Phosphorylase b kinase regulatory subunit n=1 Tax=Lingula anatina TaxID=7574 RepID=A0A1S3H5M1_LINAN|nr:phosphorylase b kinase regulatory subunit beta isoform X2 [Lingula anatina]|eukprot:XP_013380761.1 phosphorylase b kinase regulatory subunit beta isoform X2 [Lingula anatina]
MSTRENSLASVTSDTLSSFSMRLRKMSTASALNINPISDSRVSRKFLQPNMASDWVERAAERVRRLDDWYGVVKRQLMIHQNAATGLFPCNLAKAPNEAHVRDSVYCAAAIWALSLAYRKQDDDQGRTYELGQSTVKCMRGILACWMQQADRVEQFKHSQSAKTALHSKFNIKTGAIVVGDGEYQHLQIDCVAQYVLFLVQMISSGLQIIYTTDEVNFVQNLVYYLERAYRTPDYGMWERGTKYNNGNSELHASSIGMAKAALEAINGFNVFGDSGASWSVIYVDVDAHNRNRTIFDSMLPRESNSKNTDCSLIPVVSWPAFALHDENLRQRTIDKAVRKLKGTSGMKRFLRDGYGTVVEDKSRKYYRPAEIKNFDGIECEWPLFFLYMIIDGIFKNDQEKVKQYMELVKPLLAFTPDGVIVPKYFYVPLDLVDAEKEKPGSQMREPSAEEDTGHLFLWGQAVYIISQLLFENLVHPAELDPIKRHLPAAARPRQSTRYSFFQEMVGTANDLIVQIVLIAESVRLQQMLANYGILTQTPHEIEPIQVWSPNELTKAFSYLGINNKLGLTGRPLRPVGGLGTSKLYQVCGHIVVCFPLLFELSDFYLSQDMTYVIDDVKSDLAFLAKCWKLSGRPTFCMLIREENIRGPSTKEFLDLLAEFKGGQVGDIRVRLGRLQSLIPAACIENLDFLQSLIEDSECTFRHVEELKLGSSFKSLTEIPKVVPEEDIAINIEELKQLSSRDIVQKLHGFDNMHAQSQILGVLLEREGMEYRIDDSTIEQRLERLLRNSGRKKNWAVVRYCAALLGKLVDSLAPSITAILVRGKQVTIGVFGHEEDVIGKPMAPNQIKDIIYSKCMPYSISQAVLQQEIILCIGKFISTFPELFSGILKIRIGWMIEAMRLEIANLEGTELSLMALSPSEIKEVLLTVLGKYDRSIPKRAPLHKRQLDGALGRVPIDFYDRVWEILEKTPGGIKVAGYLLPQQPTLSDMTMYEMNFSLLVEQMLSKILDPAYRSVIVETLTVVSTILRRNPEIEFPAAVELDRIVHEAFEMFKRELVVHESKEKEDTTKDNMFVFYNTPPNARRGTMCYIVKAVLNTLLQGAIHTKEDDNCCVS